MKKAIGYVYVIAAAVCWGFLGLFNRVLTAAGVSLLNMMPLRFGGTAILFTVFCMMFKQQVFHIKLRHLPIFLGSGLISMLLVLCGCALVSGIVGSDVGISLEGLLMGLASELCYGGYTIFTHYGMRYCDSFTMAYWTFLIAGIASLFLADGPALLSALAEPRTGLAALGLMVMGTALPFTLYTKGLETVESGKAAIIAKEALNKSARAGSERFCSQARFEKWRNTVCISHFSNRRLGAKDPLSSRRRFVQRFPNIEPVMSAVIGVTVFQETLGLWTLVGIVLVLSGVVVLACEKEPDK